ncbi:MAG: hypothetical protein V3R52_01145 [Candidatus Neomarinimicrobiota bacterium]
MENNLDIILYVISTILIIGGLLIFFAPKLLIRISEPLNKEFGVKRQKKTLIFSDEKVLQNRHTVGPFLVALGLILIYFSIYLV